MSSFQPMNCVCQSELTEFLAELIEFAAELSEFSLPKQYSRNSIPPIPRNPERRFWGFQESSSKVTWKVNLLLWLLLDPLFRNPQNQEPRKGGFSKGGFCRIQCHAQGNKRIPKDIGGPSSTFGTQSATAKRGVHSYKNPPSKKPLFLASDRSFFRGFF